MIALPCIDCGEPATFKARCARCRAAYEARPSVRSRIARRARLVTGNNAAARLRAEMRKAIRVQCASCPRRVLASAADIDHIVPLSRGGEDVDENVQILCRPCHKAKTRRDFDFKSPPF